MLLTDCFWCGEVYEPERYERCPQCGGFALKKHQHKLLLNGSSEVVCGCSSDGSCCQEK